MDFPFFYPALPFSFYMKQNEIGWNTDKFQFKFCASFFPTSLRILLNIKPTFYNKKNKIKIYETQRERVRKKKNFTVFSDSIVMDNRTLRTNICEGNYSTFLFGLHFGPVSFSLLLFYTTIKSLMP